MYLTYAEYQALTSTPVPETIFGEYLKKAETTIDLYTFNRVRNHWDILDPYVKELVSQALVELINTMDSAEQGKLVKSESVGSWSVSYETAQNNAMKSDKEIITRHLIHTGLMYRGSGLIW